MKILKIAFIALLVSPMLFTVSSCKDDTVEPTPKDTTPVIVNTITNRFTIGFDQYDLVLDENSSYGYYRNADGLTVISIVGTSTAVSGTPIVSGRGEVEIKIATTKEGSFSQANGDDLEIEIATGEGIRRKEYSFDQNSNMKLNITKYDSVGGFIQGTFSAVLKDGINSRDVKKGEFKVERSKDQ
ncbi:MAG: hypothetical protein H6606_05725 [Flavobacteriales bacterium]|nr:hypothetical protein [Flavobacteriales bacterium]